jgi:hypothetical protein
MNDSPSGDESTSLSRRTFLRGAGAATVGIGVLERGGVRGESRNYPGPMDVASPPAFEPHPEVSNPVLTPDDVTDRSDVRYVADPFVAVEDGTYHLFFEVTYEREDASADIAHATSSDGLEWAYGGVVLDDPEHLAYPAVFRWEGEWYMTPDKATYRFDGVPEFRIYRADPFPTEWTLVERAIDGEHVGDPTLLRWNDTWYLFSVEQEEVWGTRLHYADSLLDAEWTEHPESPVATDARNFRPAGRPVVGDEAIYTFYQDVERTYGDKVRCFEVTALTREAFAHEETDASPLLEATHDGGWNDNGMHHVDAALAYTGRGNVVPVDGQDEESLWSIGLYRRREREATSTPGA